MVTRVKRIPAAGRDGARHRLRSDPRRQGRQPGAGRRRAGAAVRMVGAVGNDAFAQTALRELEAGGVDLTAVTHRAGTTGVAIITVDEGGENTIALSPGANAHADAGDHSRRRLRLRRHAAPADGGAARPELRRRGSSARRRRPRHPLAGALCAALAGRARRLRHADRQRARGGGPRHASRRRRRHAGGNRAGAGGHARPRRDRHARAGRRRRRRRQGGDPRAGAAK